MIDTTIHQLAEIDCEVQSGLSQIINHGGGIFLFLPFLFNFIYFMKNKSTTETFILKAIQILLLFYINTKY